MQKTYLQHLASVLYSLEIATNNQSDLSKLRNELVYDIGAFAGFRVQLNHDMTNLKKQTIVFDATYQWYNEHGFAIGSTFHHVKVTPAFDGFDIKVSGRDKFKHHFDIKDFLHQQFTNALNQETDFSIIGT